MSNIALSDVAEAIVKRKKKPIPFAKLWEEICETMKFSDAEKKNKMTKFYNTLSLDSRFVQLEKNSWDLRSRQTYSATRVNVESFDYDDVDDLDIDEINDESYELYDSLSEDTY